MSEPQQLLPFRAVGMVEMAASWSLLGAAPKPEHRGVALAGSLPGPVDSLRTVGAEVNMAEGEPAQDLVSRDDQARRLIDMFPQKPLTYPHRPGVPCPDCGWNGEIDAD